MADMKITYDPAKREKNGTPMNVKMPAIGAAWVDPDDAPELTGEEMDRPDAVWSIGGRRVTPDEGKAAFRAMLNVEGSVSSRKKGATTSTLDPEVRTVQGSEGIGGCIPFERMSP